MTVKEIEGWCQFLRTGLLLLSELSLQTDNQVRILTVYLNNE
jgi:hypothetical protein